jgi:hypothetical protein
MSSRDSTFFTGKLPAFTKDDQQDLCRETKALMVASMAC